MRDDLTRDLAEPFPPSEIGWKAQATSKDKTKALAVAYIDARNVMERLDAVFGVGGWQDAYEVLPDGCVMCHLSVKVGEDWVTKTDVGEESEQKAPGERRKAAFSDALKRAAVKLGIGRYLYSLEGGWVDYDDAHKKLKSTPTLPAWAMPRKPAVAANGTSPAKKPAAAKPAPLPANGTELASRIAAKDGELSAAGRIKANDLMDAVFDWGTQNDQSVNVEDWKPDCFPALMEFVKRFCADHPAPAKTPA